MNIRYGNHRPIPFHILVNRKAYGWFQQKHKSKKLKNQVADKYIPI